MVQEVLSETIDGEQVLTRLVLNSACIVTSTRFYIIRNYESPIIPNNWWIIELANIKQVNFQQDDHNALVIKTDSETYIFTSKEFDVLRQSRTFNYVLEIISRYLHSN